MTALRLPGAIEARLDRLARRTGRTSEDLATKAIKEFLEDEEDFFIALNRQQDRQPGIPLREVKKKLDEAD